MVQYSGLRRFPDDATRDRAIERLLDLRAGIANKISTRNKQDTFHLASWNIRDLGSNKFNPSPRLPETFLYIAEVISAFDLVAVQEVNENMKDFQAVMRLLGPHWDYIVTDQSGNSERLAFVFDTRKILFRHIAGEIVLPAKKGKQPVQFNRTPFLLAFQAGWFKFNICTVHIYYGSASDTTRRKQEIADLCLRHHVRVLNVPPMDKWINGELSFRQIRSLRIEDLLERDPIQLDFDNIQHQLKDQTVLITGAAGSIGSEIARQVIRFQPRKLILLDQAETPLHELELEFASIFNCQQCEIIIGDIRNQQRMEQLCQNFRPDYV